VFKILTILVLTVVNFNIDFSKQFTNIPEIKLSQGWQFCPSKNYQPNVDVSQLQCYPIEIPGPWEKALPKYDGYGLLYTTFSINKTYENIHLGLYTKHIRDADKTYINNVLIGETGDFPPDFEKAVFYSRLYSIPQNVIKFNQSNNLSIWVYNDTRPGGIFVAAPLIDSYEKLINDHYKLNYLTLSIIIILLVFSLVNIINFTLNMKSIENLYFGLFLVSWALYLFSSSDLTLALNIPLNAMFKMNLIMFYFIFILFLLFIYAFFKQRIPLIIKIILALSILFIPLSLFLPEPKQLYFLVEIIELSSILALYFAAKLFHTVIKAKLPYARIMSTVMSLYILFGIIEVMLDYFLANEATTYSPLGPWVLLVLAIVLTFIVGHKNMSYYKRATFDGLTGVLRFKNFQERLNHLLMRTNRERKVLAVLMVDLDDFKQINDKYGHMEGDKVLIFCSDVMRKELSHFDILSRYGGDEFCIAIVRNSADELEKSVAKIHREISIRKIQLNTKEINISTTIGVSLYNPKQQNKTAEILINEADDLLIKAKIDTKGKVLWQRLRAKPLL